MIFQFSSFLIIGLCNSSANSWFVIFPFLIAASEVFVSTKLQTIETSSRQHPSYFRFLATVNALSCSILPEVVPLVKSLRFS